MDADAEMVDLPPRIKEELFDTRELDPAREALVDSSILLFDIRVLLPDIEADPNCRIACDVFAASDPEEERTADVTISCRLTLATRDADADMVALVAMRWLGVAFKLAAPAMIEIAA
jgi:hypothetical protein